MKARWSAALVPLLLFLAACDSEEPSASPLAASPTPAAAALSVPPTPTPTPLSQPTAGVPTQTPTSTPEPVATFAPGPVILPTVAVLTATPTTVPDDPLTRTLAGIGLRVNVIRELISRRVTERHFVSREDLGTLLLEYFEEDREEIDQAQRLYATLGIVEQDTDLYELLLGLYSEGVLGFFDTEEETLYVVKHDQEFGPPDERTYVHELVHSLQQQNFDIHERRESLEGNSDAEGAYAALIEGDARLTELIYMSEHMDEAEQQASQPPISQELLEAFRSAPHVILREYAFPYVEGARFVLGLYRLDGWDAVNRAFEESPQSTEQILHPQRYADGEEPEDVALPDLVAHLGEGWTEVRQNTMGEFFLMAYMETVGSFESAAAAADGWGGDRYALMKGPEDESLLVLPIVWDSEADAREFMDTFLQFTQVRTGVQWEPAEGDGASRLMTLDDQVISISLDMTKTLLVFAPDDDTLELVGAAIEEQSGEQP